MRCTICGTEEFAPGMASNINYHTDAECRNALKAKLAERDAEVARLCEANERLTIGTFDAVQRANEANARNERALAVLAARSASGANMTDARDRAYVEAERELERMQKLHVLTIDALASTTPSAPVAGRSASEPSWKCGECGLKVLESSFAGDLSMSCPQCNSRIDRTLIGGRSLSSSGPSVRGAPVAVRSASDDAQLKPHEEKWATDGQSLYVAGEDGERIQQFARVDEPVLDGDSWAQDRAELAAAAPQMARLLLRFREYGWMGKAARAEVDAVLAEAGVPVEKKQGST